MVHHIEFDRLAAPQEMAVKHLMRAARRITSGNHEQVVPELFYQELQKALDEVARVL